MERIGHMGKNMQVATAMAMAGRSARPCDVCGMDRARWYCAADEAYFCDRCDGAVHSANTVALRHERVRVSPHGLPSRPSKISFSPSAADKITRSSSSPLYGWQQSRSQYKKPRSSRPHPHSIAFSLDSRVSSTEAEREQIIIGAVKEEPSSPLMQSSTPVSQPFLNDRSKYLEADESSPAHEVPVLLSTKQLELYPRGSLQDCTIMVGSLGSVDANPSYNALEFVVPDADSSAIYNRSVSSDSELIQRGSKSLESMISCEKASFSSELSLMDDLGVLGLCGGDDLDVVYSMDLCSMKEFREEDAGGSDNDGGENEVEGISEGEAVGEGKVKIEECTWWEDELKGVNIEVDEMFACDWNGWNEEEDLQQLEAKQKISLSLNYDDVLSAWSDRGPLWADGRRPQIVPDCPSYGSCVENIGLDPDINFCSPGISIASGEQHGQVPVLSNVAGEDSRNVREREARVLRYREKRRTRLFSKKIRYEVRKLNAERRPRLKGRFVKKTTSCS